MPRRDQAGSRRRATERLGVDPDSPEFEIYNLQNRRHGGARSIVDARPSSRGWLIRDDSHPNFEVGVLTQEDARIYARLDFAMLEHIMDLAHLRGPDSELTLTVKRR
jgi:hypothetical protein